METDATSSVVNNETIDKVTLELLMNKQHYRKYIAKTDPAKHEEYVKHQALISKYKHRIVSITNDLLSSPSKQITTDVNDVFNGYVKTLIKYFQMKDMENKSNEHSDEDDVLFGNMDEETHLKSEEAEYNSDEGDEPVQDTIMHSFWGGKRVVKHKYTKPTNK
jgi:hypothetical protein